MSASYAVQDDLSSRCLDMVTVDIGFGAAQIFKGRNSVPPKVIWISILMPHLLGGEVHFDIYNQSLLGGGFISCVHIMHPLF